MSVSRTIYVKDESDISASDKWLKGLTVKITNGTYGTYLEFDDLDDSKTIYTYLKDHDYKAKYVEYALFYTTIDELESAQDAEELIKGFSNPHIIYINLRANKKCGKVVVDRLEDFQGLKSLDDETGLISFKRFKTKNDFKKMSKKRSKHNNKSHHEDDDESETSV